MPDPPVHHDSIYQGNKSLIPRRVLMTGLLLTVGGWALTMGVSMGNVNHIMDKTADTLEFVFFIGLGVTCLGALMAVGQFLLDLFIKYRSG